MGVNRRSFLTGLTATLVAGCSADPTGSRPEPTVASGGAPGVPTLDPSPGLVDATSDVNVTLGWPVVDGALDYDVELNGEVIATNLEQPGLQLRFGDRSFAPQAGRNRWRVRASNSSGGRWSQLSGFEVVSVGQIRARTFDYEDRGPIELTVPSTGTVIDVDEDFAFGDGGQGVSLRCENSTDTRAYKNHDQLEVDACWVRLCVKPQTWSSAGTSVNLARIQGEGGTESVFWRTGGGLHSTSVAGAAGLPTDEWTQMQLGVLADGSVELWQFAEGREVLIGRVGSGQGAIGGTKTRVSIGNINPNLGITFEIWLDEFAVGQHKLPWANPVLDRTTIQRPKLLDPADLGDEFSFTFGSCNNSTFLPYDTMALGAAAREDADFFIHLGDHGYPDTGAYRQSAASYVSLWTDLAHESNLTRLSRKPWLYLASDHDLGGNNIGSDNVPVFAQRAFNEWQNNDRSVDPTGAYGHLFMADGEIELIWLEEVAYRSPIDAPNNAEKTCLGPKQKAWFLDRLARSEAELVIVASQTTLGHVSESGWVQYNTERQELVDACLARDGWTRWLSGDKHTARWAWFEDRLVEWGAAALAEIPQGEPQAAPGVVFDASGPAGSFPTRKAALETLTLPGVAAATSFGLVKVDTVAGTAAFTVRDNVGDVRIQRDGTVLEETISYRERPWRLG